jgi:carbonic anhydrase
MACNAPINIIRKTADKCSLKCLLWYKYGNSSCTVKNAKDQLVITYDGASDVMFNSINYNPTEIRIFKPSIHKFDGTYADGEMVIVHSGSNGGLVICIPINTTAGIPATAGTNVIHDIIASSPAQDQTTTLNIADFNLGNIIPKSGYYSYTGTLPYGECNPDSQYNFVVFPLNSFSVSQSTIDSLGELIHDSYIPVYDGTCYWNETGTKSNGFSGEGQIYIDCQPVGEEGEIIYKEQSGPRLNLNSGTYKQVLDWIYAFLYILIGIFLMYIGAKLMIWMMSRIPDLPDYQKNNI